MIVELDSLETAPKEFSFEIASGDIDLGEDSARLIGHLRVSGTVAPLPKIEVVGRIEGSLELDCTRCLSPMPYPIDINFDDVFVEAAEMNASDERELDSSDMKADVLSEGKIDLKEVAREQILLSLPTQVFCSEDCKGLCDRCGANLNRGTCDCGKDDIDPRWAALKNLK